LINSRLLGVHSSAKPPEVQTGPGASAISNDDGNYMTLVMVNMASNAEQSDKEEISSAGVDQSDVLTQIASSNPAPLLEPNQFESDENDEKAVHTAGDPAIQAKLFGSYTSQIDARIRRAWRKPRSAIAPPTLNSEGRAYQKKTFTCNARITQDQDGNVTEVELMQCDGSTDWQMSLVNAIQRASPLPAPPSQSVFTNVLTMSFEGRAYVPGSREDEYEPSSAAVARATLER
jgi:hypothetical protein